MAEINLTLSVVCYASGTAATVRQALESLAGKPQPNVRVVVVDSSSDPLQEKLQNLPAWDKVEWLDGSQATNRAAGWRIGTSDAQTTHYLLTDCALKLDGEMLDKVMDFFAAHPNNGVVGLQRLDRDAHLVSSAARLPAWWRLLSGGTLRRISPAIFNRYISDQIPASKEARATAVDSLNGPAIMLSRRVLRDLNGLDETLAPPYDLYDLCYRAKRRGWRVKLSDATCSYHTGEDDSCYPVLNSLESYSDLLAYCRKNTTFYHLLAIEGSLLAVCGVRYLSRKAERKHWAAIMRSIATGKA